MYCIHLSSHWATGTPFISCHVFHAFSHNQPGGNDGPNVDLECSRIAARTLVWFHLSISVLIWVLSSRNWLMSRAFSLSVVYCENIRLCVVHLWTYLRLNDVGHWSQWQCCLRLCCLLSLAFLLAWGNGLYRSVIVDLVVSRLVRGLLW